MIEYEVIKRRLGEGKPITQLPDSDEDEYEYLDDDEDEYEYVNDFV